MLTLARSKADHVTVPGDLKSCDVVLKAGETEIPSNRSVLAAVSPYFSAMFTHNWMESRQDVIKIKDMPGHVLSSIIDFAYTGDIELTVDNVQDILSASSYLLIDEVRDLCCSFLVKATGRFKLSRD